MTSRGIRLFNPGNIDHNPNSIWDGEIVPSEDSRFCTFNNFSYGCRALLKVLRTYVEKHGLKTVREIINRWAPPSENNTDSYVMHVASAAGVDADTEIPFDVDPSYYLAIGKAIARHENGADAELIPNDAWEEAYKLAGL